MTDDSVKSLANVPVHLKMNYFSPIKVGNTIVIELETLKKKNSLIFFVVNLIEKKSHRLLARGSHVKYIGVSNL